MEGTGFTAGAGAVVSVEGNIGSGKSAALEALAARRPDLRVRQEPVDAWGELLALYYADPVAWSLAFNLKVLHSFVEARRPGVDGSGSSCSGSSCSVIERSPGACRHVFGQLAYNDNHLGPEAWTVFKGYHDLLGWEPDAYVYIDTPPAVCFERMSTRGRECESGVTEAYLARIEFQYANFLKFTKVPVFRVNGARPPDVVAREVEALVATVTAMAARHAPAN